MPRSALPASVSGTYDRKQDEFERRQCTNDQVKGVSHGIFERKCIVIGNVQAGQTTVRPVWRVQISHYMSRDTFEGDGVHVVACDLAVAP